MLEQFRAVKYSVDIIAISQDPPEAEACTRWAREFSAAIRPFTGGAVYVNYPGGEGEQRIRSAYGANYARLAPAKAKYDPENVFRWNRNIRPQLGVQ